MIQYLTSHHHRHNNRDHTQAQPRSPSPALDDDQSSVLDLGCGNGSILFALREQHQFAKGRFLGVDYSHASVELARAVGRGQGGSGEEEEEEEEASDIDFRQWDILQGSYDDVLTGEQSNGWDVVLDKGTFDAVSLSNDEVQGRRICALYPERILPLVKTGGIFLVTSCNWTEEELVAWFASKNATPCPAFEVVGRVDYKTFSFGGVKGQTISTVCFRKIQNATAGHR